MVQIVSGGSAAFNNLVFGGPDLTLRDHLAQQFRSASQNLTEVGQRLYQESRQMFERFSGDAAMSYLKSVGRAISAVWQTDSIRFIDSVGGLQVAPLTMQRWIMAEPTLRKMYHEQRVDGYSGSYIDMEPGAVGHDQYDYRRLMDGMIEFNENAEGDEPEWHATMYFDEAYEGDQELSIDERADILQTWEVLRTSLKYGRSDPTSRFDASLD